MLIYKYTSFCAGKLIVEKSSVRFSPVEALNNPFELTPSLDKFKRSIKKYVRNTQEFKDNSKNMSFIEKEASIQRIVQPSIAEIDNIIKKNLILSLTKKKDSSLMWSHYADSHCGIVIGFDYNNAFFHQVKHPKITCSYDVIYTGERPEFFDFKNFWNRSISVDDFRKMLLTKSLEWEYEEEVRMFAFPSAGKNVGKDKNDFDIHLFNFPKESIKEIIFGSQIGKTEKAELVNISRKPYPHVKLFEAIQTDTGYGLKYNPYND